MGLKDFWLVELPRKVGIKNFWLYELWFNAPAEITIWGKVWRSALMLGFWVVVLGLMVFSALFSSN